MNKGRDMKILSVDVGTTAMKMGVFEKEGRDIVPTLQFSRDYPIHTYNGGLFSDIEPKKWQQAFMAGCRSLEPAMADIDVIALSGTTPGLTAMDKGGEALYPAILMLDQRSRTQAARIIDTIGADRLLRVTANMPVAGGCSLASILWIKDNLPEVFRKTAVFGHSNTFMARWLAHKFAMDPSSASLTAAYNTAANDLTWNQEILQEMGLTASQLPDLIPAYHSAGRLNGDISSRTGMRKKPPVLIGGNDAVLAAFSVGIKDPGEVFNINGTCEITMTCMSKCFPSKNYNIRTHVVPERWFSFYVMNAGGKALEWFKSLFCSEMTDGAFCDDFLPAAVDTWLERESQVTYVPFLLGSRYSLEPLKAEFLGLTPETTREELLAALVRGLCGYQRENLKEVSIEMPLADRIVVSGGAVNAALIRAKSKWMRDCGYHFEAESSLKGAALLGKKYLETASE